jgi:hypothetical protein
MQRQPRIDLYYPAKNWILPATSDSPGEVSMISIFSRRSLLKFASTIFPLRAAGLPAALLGSETPNDVGLSMPVSDNFPTQPPELVREMVTVAHFDLKRVRELVEARPSLARAAWDWGFGDWETALGGASHMGNRPIAEYLISKGARPSLFSAAMLGQLDVVKAFVAAHPDVQRIRGPHSISLLAHAKAGGEAARPVYDFLHELGDADAEPPVPVADSDVASLVGIYSFGIGVNQQIEVTAEHGQLTWTRKGMMGRPLFHLGERAFHPAGAEVVRIRFAEENGGMVMTVSDPQVVLTTRRIQPRK